MPATESLDYLSGSDTSADKPPSRAFVLFAIGATLALLMAMVALLVYRAIKQHAPINALIVQADERWRGVSLTVDGLSLSRPLEATLDKANKYVVSFFLDSGIYELHVRYGDEELVRYPLELKTDGETVGIDLVHSNLKPPATQPASQPAR